MKLKLKLFFTSLLLLGIIFFGLNKSKNNNILVNKVDSSFSNNDISPRDTNPFTQVGNVDFDPLIDEDLEMLEKQEELLQMENFEKNDYRNSEIVDNSIRKNDFTYYNPLENENSTIIKEQEVQEIEEQEDLIQMEKIENRYMQDKRNNSMGIHSVTRDSEEPLDDVNIRSSDDAKYDLNLDQDIDIEKDPSEINNNEISDNTQTSSGYMSGEIINKNNISSTRSNVFLQNSIDTDSNKSVFPVKSREALHDCYFDSQAKMQCRKSIIECKENGELGLKCTISYYLNGIWHNDPTQLTIEDDPKLIKKHLETKTTFALPKFTLAYDKEKYAKTNLIRADLNTTKKLKLKQIKQYIPNETKLDKGIVKLFENNNTRTATSVLVNTTRFGIGHEKVQGGNSELLQALRDYLSQFSTSDDNDIYSVPDYWTLMDDSHKFGDCEDIALTALEWLLRNGVDPKYLTLTEVKKYGVDTTHITLVIQTKEPAQKWIVNDLDVVEIENLYPNGYESLLINSYQYVD